MGFINIGFGNIINDSRIVAIVSPDSAPSKRMLQNSRDEGKVIDATQGRRTRAIIVTDTGNIVLSALQPETVASRVQSALETYGNGNQAGTAEGDKGDIDG